MSSTNSRVTRAANKSTHPGIPDIDDEVMGRPQPKARRTKAQVAADSIVAAEKKLAKAAEVKSNNEKRALLIARIASLEKEMQEDDQHAEREAARPPAKSNKRIIMMVKSLVTGTNIHSFECVIYV